MIYLFRIQKRSLITPGKKDLLKAIKNSSIPIIDIKDLKKEVDEICGGTPAKPELNKDKVVAIVKWVDGTVLDTVFRVTY